MAVRLNQLQREELGLVEQVPTLLSAEPQALRMTLHRTRITVRGACCCSMITKRIDILKSSIEFRFVACERVEA